MSVKQEQEKSEKLLQDAVSRETQRAEQLLSEQHERLTSALQEEKERQQQEMKTQLQEAQDKHQVRERDLKLSGKRSFTKLVTLWSRFVYNPLVKGPGKSQMVKGPQTNKLITLTT